MARIKKEYWVPYCDDFHGNITVWKNEASTAMKAVDKNSIPDRLFEYTFPHGPTYGQYKVASKIEGNGLNKNKKGKIEAELPVLKVESVSGKNGFYDIIIIKKVQQKKCEMYLGVENGPLFILNPDGSCGLVACVLPDEFKEGV